MNPDTKFQGAIQQQVVWKNEEVHRFAVGLIKHALEAEGGRGASHFTTDIVPDTERGSGTGIAGTCVEILKTSGLIESVGITKDGTFYQHRIKSTREGRNGAWLNVYKLTSRAMAEEFLKRHGHVPLQQQLTLV